MAENVDLSQRALTPLSNKMLTDIEHKNMDKTSPILVRLFKQEAELEVWKKDRNGDYALLKTYPICRWSGELGPKLREGDRQAPEGFYSITPGQMNPKSQYYLAFNMGYPNAYDRAWGRTGAELMIHGDCSSRGCYAMTDEQIAEIYALGREAFFGGQRAFQVQAYPFRMTSENFAKHRNNPNVAFWKVLKRGSDHFEITKQEPKVDVCEKHYVFNARAPANSSTPLSFSPTGKCPAYEVQADVLAAVNDKQRRDEYQTAELINRGTRTSPIRTGADGGMHPVFLTALHRQDPTTGGNPVTTLGMQAVPGTIPRHVVPPRTPEQVATAQASATASVPAPTPVVQRPAAPALQVTATSNTAAPAQRSVNNSLLSNNTPTSNIRAASSLREATGNAAAKQAQPARPVPVVQAPPAANVAIRPKPAVAEAPAPAKPAAEAKPANEQRAAASSGLMQNTAPMATAGSFESRWSAINSRSRF